MGVVQHTEKHWESLLLCMQKRDHCRFLDVSPTKRFLDMDINIFSGGSRN